MSTRLQSPNTLHMEEAKRISIHLKEKYGTEQDGRPRFRLVWSDNQTEKYSGKREVWKDGIFLRIEDGIHEVKKYSYISERFVLERLVFMPIEEIPESVNGHYEPVYVFWDKDKNYLKPNILVCDMVINWLLYRKVEKILNWDDEEKKKDALELQSYFEAFDEGDIPMALRIGEGITVPSNYSS